MGGPEAVEDQFGFAPGAEQRCVALVDAGFLRWLLDPESDDPGPEAEPGPVADASVGKRSTRDDRTPERLPQRLGGVIRAAGLRARLLRTYWYDAAPPRRAVPGLVCRPVAAEPAGAGASLLLAMARDAMQLAREGGIDHLLIVSDDDRLLSVVDQVQLHGVQVQLLADESALDLDALAATEPGWTTLLRQADRRLVVDGECRLFIPGANSAPRQMSPSDADISPLVDRWLAQLPADVTALYRAQLPPERGLPAEADRDLLLSISRSFGRPLTVAERKGMREQARAALAQTTEDDASAALRAG